MPFAAVRAPLQFGDDGVDEVQHGKLGDEGFGGGDADFPPGAGEDGVRGGAGQRAFGKCAG